MVAFQQYWRDMQSMQDMPGMDMQQDKAPETPAVLAKRLATRRKANSITIWPELLVTLAGVFLLTQDKLAKRWPAVRYVWPCCFLAAGIFLLIFSDTEMWPFGNQGIWFAITHNSEVLQHKTFAVILLASRCRRTATRSRHIAEPGALGVPGRRYDGSRDATISSSLRWHERRASHGDDGARSEAAS